MSNFPEPDYYKKSFSNYHSNYLKKYNIISPIIIKKLKHQYIYDIDNYKYIDFNLNNGSVIYGHSIGTLTNHIKNGISSGIESSLINKFYTRLIKYIENIIEFNNISFYTNTFNALYILISTLNINEISVNTSYLYNLLKNYFPHLKIHFINNKLSHKMILFEPINFDDDLSTFDYKKYSADYYISFESRVAFRLKYGFLCNLKDVNAIISANNIANGMDCCLILSNTYFNGEILPIYKTIAILETLKFYLRKINYDNFEIKGKISSYIIKNRNIFLLKKNYNFEELLKYGIYLNNTIGFISYSHTYHDINRFYKALNLISN